MPNRIEITILGQDQQSDSKKTAVFPSRKARRFGRRRLNEPQIRFYDLAQVNHEDLNDDPIWSDHPVLKTPSYTTEAAIWGTGDNYFAGVRYLLEPFENADYAAYTSMMFNYPVTEWKQRYRRIEGIPGYGDTRASNDYRFDMRFSLRDSTYSGTEELLMPARLLSRSFLGDVTFNNSKETYLTDYHHFWHNDRNFAGYRDLDQLTGQYQAFGSDGFISGGYFPYSSDNSYFKVTATNDPDASPVTLGDPSGSYDIFLMPQVGFFMATANSSDWKTTEVLGLCYQVMPRYQWPRFTEGLQTGSGGQYGSDSAVSTWFNYQQIRSGMQFSSWTYTGTGDPSDYSYTETLGVPADWTGLAQWGSAVNGDDANPSGYYYSKQSRGAFTADTEPTYSTLFRADTPDANFGNALFRNTDPFLTAVIQKGGAFYYVWDISHSVDPFGNFSTFETIGQHDRYRLSRGIDWDPAHIDQDPPQPRDGTGAYDY